MNLKLSTEKNEFCESIKTFLNDRVSSEYLRKRVIGGTPDSNLWPSLLEIGVFEICGMPESGITLLDCCSIIQDFAYHLIPEPVAQQCLFGSYLFSKLNEESKKELRDAKIDIEQIVKGELLISTSMSPSSVNKDKFYFIPRTSKTKYFLNVCNSEVLIFDLDQISLNKATAIDLTLDFYEMKIDSKPIVKISQISSDFIENYKKLIVVHELAGMLKKVTDLTKDYVVNRKQFGVPVGSFQAVQHKLADIKVVADSLESLALFSAWALENSKEQAELAIESALRFALNKSVEAIEQTIQLHGGIGFTWEYELHLYLRRALFYQSLWSESSKADNLLALASKL
jgi:hypothetical protein